MKKLPRLILKLIETRIIENPPEGVNCVDYVKMLETAQIKGWTPPTQEQLESVIEICEFEDLQQKALNMLKARANELAEQPVSLKLLSLVVSDNRARTQIGGYVDNIKTEYLRVKGLIESAKTKEELKQAYESVNFPKGW